MARKHPLAECEVCPLKESPCAPTSGNIEKANVAFVSRSPGKHDVRGGKPFSGPSGEVLDHLLARHGVDRSNIITTNVVLCQTDDPPKEAIKACNLRLESELSNCDLVIAGGTEATQALTKYRGVARSRGFSIHRSSITGKKQRVIVTNNPAMVMRNSDSYPDMVKDFKRAFNPLPPPVFPRVEIINERSRIRSVLRKWLDTEFNTPIASDLEWSARTPTCAGFSRDGKRAVVFGSECFEDAESLRLIKLFYERDDIRFIWHNGKDDTKILRWNSIEGRVDEDTFLISYALDERPGYHKLEYLLSEEFGWPDYEPKGVKYFKSHGEFDPKENRRRAENELYKYNGWDAAGTAQLFQLLHPKLEQNGVTECYRNLLHASERFTTVELNGFNFDSEEACNIQEREVIPRLWGLEEKLRGISGRSLLNPRSWKQLQGIYYTQWGLKHSLRDQGKKKLSKSTGREVREEIRAGRFTSKNPHRGRVQSFEIEHSAFNKIAKVGDNYLVGLAVRVSEDGKLYCRFNIGGTVTGRTSSSDPNFQNITREGVEGIPGIRNLFLPSPGNVIISADYSQAELRTCAKLSGDTNFLDIYRDSSRSLHRERAAAFYGDNYTKEEYVKSKNINFGVTYGQSAAAFAQMYHMPQSEAQDYINSWWREFPQLKEWTVATAGRAFTDGFVQSPFGHKRRFHLITDENVGDIRRESVNFLPQNIAAWLTIYSLCDLVDSGVSVVATVHDSIVADVPIGEVDTTVALMRKIMTEQPIKQLNWERDDIPFEVDISVGDSWGTIKEVELIAA
jgi:uracil-DNA glycosylase family 4